MATAVVENSSNVSAEIIAAFRKHDDTGNGTIEREVLGNVLAALGFQCEDVLAQFGARSAEEICYSDFVKWIWGETRESNSGTKSNSEPPLEDCAAYEVCGIKYKEVQAKRTKFHVKDGMQFVRVLGESSFGTTAMFKEAETGNLCAIKMFPNAFADLSVAQRMLREVKLQMFLRHDNILGISDISPPRDVDFDVVYTTQTYMETHLHNILRSKQILQTEHIQYFLYQILRGVRYLHSVGVAHCDIKPSSLLVDTGSFSLRISDFGNSRSIVASGTLEGEGNSNDSVIRSYQSPEDMLSVGGFPAPMDIWSVGCVLGEMFLRKPLFRGKQQFDQLESILQLLGSPSALQLEWIPAGSKFLTWLETQNTFLKRPLPSLLIGASADALSMLDVMLTFDPRERADATQCLNHAFLAQLHDPSKELEAKNKFDWSFQRANPSKRSLQNGIYVESTRLYPELLKRDEQFLAKLGIYKELFRMRANESMV